MNDLSKLNYSQGAHQGFEKISRNLLYKWTGSYQRRDNSVIPGHSETWWPHCATPHWIQPEGQSRGRAGLGPGAEETRGGGYAWALSVGSGEDRKPRGSAALACKVRGQWVYGRWGTREREDAVGRRGNPESPPGQKGQQGTGALAPPGARGAHSLQKTYSV